MSSACVRSLTAILSSRHAHAFLGATDEIAFDARRLGLGKVLIAVPTTAGTGSETTAPEVTAAAGADILTHAIESYTTRPYNARPKHPPPDRPAYIGANPTSDVWCEKAIE